MTSWNGPAIGAVMAKLVELALRAERVRIAAKVKANAKVLALLAREPEQ